MDFVPPGPVPTQSHREKRPFTTEEDARLNDLVSQHGDHAWHEIERHMPGRSARQCRERWALYLSPSVANDPWTTEEDMALMRLYSVLGPKWTLIAKNFPKRTANNVKNRQKQMLRRAQRMTRLTPGDAHSMGFDAAALAQLSVVATTGAPTGAAPADVEPVKSELP
jgi:hypothetical protein